MPDLLQGLRVVEGASFVAAPLCGLHLAQMGAEVIRFDPIGGGPDFDRWPLSRNGASLYWEGLNKGKKSIALDLKHPEGRELAIALATTPGDTAGLFVTNFPKNGFLAYEQLRAHRPDLICLRVMGWADGSPAVDYTINCAVGLPHMTGHPDDPRPINHVLPAWDLLTGTYAAFALVAAERHRRMHGTGRHLELALADVATATLSHLGQVAEVTERGDRPRLGNDLFGAFGRDFATRDGRRIMLVALTSRQWSQLVTACSLSEPIAQLERTLDTSFASAGARFEHRDRLFPLFEAVFAARSLEDIATMFEGRGICWSVYRSLAEAVSTQEHMFARNSVFAPVLQPSGLTYSAAGSPLRTDEEGQIGVVPAPRLGAHTDQVLTEVLGLSTAEIGRLHDLGIVAGPQLGT